MNEDLGQTQPSRFMQDPTPDFVERCREVVDQWEIGALPVKDAIAALRQFREQASILRYLANQGYAEHLLGYIEHLRGNLESSIQHYLRARAIYERIENRKFIAQMNLNLGENYRFQGNFDRALELYEDAYTTAGSLGNLFLQTFALLNKGMALLDLDELNNAHQALQDALSLTQRWLDHLEQREGVLCEIHYGLALFYWQNNDSDAAWKNALQAHEMAQKNNQPRSAGYAYRITGILVSEWGTVPGSTLSTDPDDHFQKALLAFRTINAEAELARHQPVVVMVDHRNGLKNTASAEKPLAFFSISS